MVVECVTFESLIWDEYKVAPVYDRTLVVTNSEGIDYVELYLIYRNSEETVTVIKYIGHVKITGSMTLHNVVYVESRDRVLKVYIKPPSYELVIQEDI